MDQLMKQTPFFVSISVGAILVFLGCSMRDKEGLFVFFSGSAILLCTLAVFGIRAAGPKTNSVSTNWSALVGAIVGMCLGAYVGPLTGLGILMIAFFNPQLPERDFNSVFGAMGGSILGALLLGTFSATLNKLSGKFEQD